MIRALLLAPLGLLAMTSTAWTPVDELRFATASNATCRQMYDLWDERGISLFVLPEIEANCRRCVVRRVAKEGPRI